jgi:prepilin-type N-terminal cleavage/methylation domain-containing protein
MNSLNKKGFTLIELMIVMAIIAILGIAASQGVFSVFGGARDTQRISDIQAIKTYLQSGALQGRSLPAETRCIAVGDGSAGDQINAKLSDFGGVFPTDPEETNVLNIDDAECVGTYGYVKLEPETGYDAAVLAAVESPEKGNVVCDVIFDGGAIVLTPDNEDNDCYVGLIQE